jgi:hypothetical protein
MAAGSAAGSTPGKAAQQQQQGVRAGSPLQQQQPPGQTCDQKVDHKLDQPQQVLAGHPSGLKSIKTHSRPSSSKRPSSAAAGSSSSRASWAVPGSVASKFACFEDYLAAREYELYLELGPGQGVSELIAASHAAALSNGPQVRLVPAAEAAAEAAG